MKKLKYIGILFLLILFSCVDDESRYGDIDIDEIKIEGIKDYQEIEVGGKLTITPVVTTKFGEKSDLSYVWYKYNEEQSVADTLSFEKNLDVVISDVLPGVKTTLKFKVTDNKTGLYVIEESSFTTIGKYSGGTLMLCKTGGEYDLTMLKKDGTTLYEKIYTQINEGEKLSEVHYREYYGEDGSITGTAAYDRARLKKGVKYYYMVSAYGEKGTRIASYMTSEYGTQVASGKPAVIIYGVKVAAKVKNNKKGTVTVSYNKVTGAKTYQIYRAEKKNGKYTLIGTTKKTSFADKKAKKKKTYYYKVVVNGRNELLADFTIRSSAVKIKVKK